MTIGILLWLSATPNNMMTVSAWTVKEALPQRKADTTLSFSHDSLLHTTLHTHGTNDPAYIIETNNALGRTIVRRMYPDNKSAVEVVRIERHNLSHDKITFQGFPSRNVSGWLKRLTFSDPVRLLSDSPHYVWRPTHTQEIALYREGESLDPIAWFRASSSEQPPTLSFRTEAEPIQDAIVASLVIVEQRYRLQSPRGTIKISRKPT